MSHARLPPLVAARHVASPLGAIDLVAGATGLAGLWFQGQRHHPGPDVFARETRSPLLDAAVEALEAYFGGDAHALDRLPVEFGGTPFQRDVWRALEAIPVGTTVTYGEVARLVGVAQAVRAVGAAVGKNPVSLRVPCHRVVGHDGTLTGYAGGLDRKAALLKLEGALP